MLPQEHFDELVAEGIEEFELSREDAISDAVKQLTDQTTVQHRLI